MTETETGLIAIVDDDRLIRRSLERLLKSAGLKAKSFESAEHYLDEGDRIWHLLHHPRYWSAGHERIRIASPAGGRTQPDCRWYSFRRATNQR